MKNKHPGPEADVPGPSSSSAILQLQWPGAQELRLLFSGLLREAREFPTVETVWAEISRHADQIRQVSIDCSQVQSWDSRLPAYVANLRQKCEAAGVSLTSCGLPPGVDRLVNLAAARSPAQTVSRRPETGSVLFRLGEAAVNLGKTLQQLLVFCSRVLVSCLSLLQGKRHFRKQELPTLLHECGSQALPIVSLLSLLVGLILAFVGAVQLKTFGAQIYVADLVGIAMAREMGAIMTGVIMAGRTGAAFAAHLGTMHVNEEIDALQTMGISPVDFLVLPRMLVLVCMMPLLCLYADLMGIVGGSIVGVGLFDISFYQYLEQTKEAVTLSNIWLGLIKSLVFGMIIAIAGCYQGLHAGRSASAVGLAATSAVVVSIVVIVAVDGLFAVCFHSLGI